MSTPMEKIKAFHSIKSFLDTNQKLLVSQMLGLTETDLNERQFGKDKEFEFILLAVALNQVEDMIAFEEGVSRLTNTVTTDLLLILKNNKRIAVEIKSTQGDKIPIKNAMLKDKKRFASLINAELYFAINIHGLWILLSADQIENSLTEEDKRKGKRNYSIDISFYTKSKMHELGEKSFLFVNQITFESKYTNKEEVNNDWVSHPDFGALIDYKVKMGDIVVSHFLPTTIDKFKSILFEALQDKASINYQQILTLNDNETLIIEKTPHKLHISLSDFLLAPITHIVNDYQVGFDYVQYITKVVDESGYKLFRPNDVISLINHFKSCKAYISELKVGN